MNLTRHLDKVKRAVNTAHNATEAALMKRDEATERIREKSASDKWYTQQQAQADNERAESDLNAELAEALRVYNEQESAAREELLKDLHDHYKLDGAKIVKADTDLLNSGIRLTIDEVGDMLQANADNVTMLRIIAKYVRGQGYEGITYEIARTMQKVEHPGEAELKAFDHFCGVAHEGIGAKSTMYIAVQRSLERLYAEAEIDMMGAKPVLTAADKDAISKKESALKELLEAQKDEAMK